MIPSRRVLCLLLTTAAAAWDPTRAGALALDPFLSPSPDSADEPGVLAMTNDSFGPGPVDEWDDLDSFGLRFTEPIGQASILGAISGLTDRGSSGAANGRIDEASIGGAWSVVSGPSIRALVAAGFDATGNFGGLLIQQSFHSGTGVDRPVPTTYDGGLALAPLGAFKLQLNVATPWSPYLILAGRGSLPARGSLLAVAGIRYAKPGALLAFGGGWRAAGGAASSSTLRAVDAAENGPYVGLQVRTGLLAFSFEDIPPLKKTNGSLGVVLGEPQSPEPDSTPLALDLGLLAGSSVAERVRLAVGMTGRLEDPHAEMFLSFAQGWYVSDHPDFTATFFSEYSAGGAVSLVLVRGLLSLDLGLGPFLSFEQFSTNTLLWSNPLGYRDMLGLEAEAGVHVRAPFPKAPFGVGWRIRWRAFQAIVLQTEQEFAGRSPVDFEIFLFSGS